jgi:lambda family phage minor tail protein L
MSTIRADVAGLDPLNIVEMFELDTTPIGLTEVLRWTQDPALDAVELVWQGLTYTAFPIHAEGFAAATSGALPRPTLSASNLGGVLGQYLRSIRDALGARLTRRRTLVKYLDAINFPAGNAAADPNAHLPDDVYYVARRVSENAIGVTFECAAAFDVQGVLLPRRQVIASTCSWIYRGPECGYAGPPVADIANRPTSDPAKDRCRKTLAACRLRFPLPTPLPTSAFPASLLISG